MQSARHQRLHLVELYYMRVFEIAYQSIGDATLATRATKTILERALRSLPTAEQEPVAIWRTALKVLRGYRTRGLTVTQLLPESLDWQTVLLHRLELLAPEDRILLLLRYREGLNEQQLVDVVQLDPHTLRQRLSQARDRILAEQDVDALH